MALIRMEESDKAPSGILKVGMLLHIFLLSIYVPLVHLDGFLMHLQGKEGIVIILYAPQHQFDMMRNEALCVLSHYEGQYTDHL